MPIMTCPACGGAIPDGARFCPSCGRPVSVAGGEERKLATIVFADLTDSSQLATRMDAEALRALLADVYDQLSQVVASFGGTVEKFIGDAIMAVFGVPTAHEDDPERAVRAALGMRSRLTGIARRHGQRADPARGRQHRRRRHRLRHRPRLPGHRRRRQRRRPPAAGGRARRGAGRRPHLPRAPAARPDRPAAHGDVQGPRGRHPGPRGRAHRALDRVPAAPVSPARSSAGRASCR